MPAGPEGIIKFSVMPSGKNPSLIKDQCSDFHDFFFQMIRKMSWIQIYMMKYVVTTSTDTFGS